MPYKKIAGSSMYTTHAYISIYIYVHAHIYIYAYIFMEIPITSYNPICLGCVCVCHMPIDLPIYLSIYRSIYLYIYICIHTYIQYIHIHSCTDSWPRKHHPTNQGLPSSYPIFTAFPSEVHSSRGIDPRGQSYLDRLLVSIP